MMTSTAIRQLAEESRAQASSIRTQMPEAQRALARAIVKGSGKDAEAAGKELARLRGSIQQAEDAAAGLGRLAVEVEHQDASAELTRLMAERKPVASKVDALVSEIEAKQKPPFTISLEEALKPLRRQLHEARSQLDSIDAQAVALRENLERDHSFLTGARP